MLYIIRPDNEVKQTIIQDLDDLVPWETYDIEIKKHVKSKTRQQEKYFHAILGIICDHTGDDAGDAKDKQDAMTQIKRRITSACGLIEEYTYESDVICEETGQVLVPAGHRATFPRHTSGLKVKEYAKIITAAQMICMDLGLKYPEPSHYGFDKVV